MTSTQSSLLPEGNPATIVPVLTLTDGKPTCLSTDVAQHFGKRHDHVLRDIENLLPYLSADHAPNFGETVISRENPSGGAPIESKAYTLTRDGFTLLAMGFTGKRALRFKLAYIDAFNQMEAELYGQSAPRLDSAASQPAQPARLPVAESTAQDIACMAGHLQQKLLQEVIIPCLSGAVGVGQRWVLTLAPDDQGAPLIALLQALDADVILSRALEAAPQQRRSVSLAAYGGNKN